MAYTRAAAPAELADVEVLCNSARFLHGEDHLAEPGAARDWLRAHGWERAAADLDERSLRELRHFREALREHLDREPRDGEASQDARDTLNTWARAVLHPPQWMEGGAVALHTAEGTGVDGLVGGVLAALAVAELTRGRGRLKVCRAADCRWVFYDRSPANSGVWCSMEICGARHKMRNYRFRHAEDDR